MVLALLIQETRPQGPTLLLEALFWRRGLMLTTRTQG
jgi:hypothetical protein